MVVRPTSRRCPSCARVQMINPATNPSCPTCGPTTWVDASSPLPGPSETCAYCKEPVVPGKTNKGSPLLRRDASGDPFHGPTCYYKINRSRKAS